MTKVGVLAVAALLLRATLAAPAIAAAVEAKLPPGEALTVDEARLPPVRPWAAKRIGRAYEELAAERYDDMRLTLDEMRANPRLNAREEALMWQAFAYLHTARDDYQPAAAAMEESLAAGGLDPTAAMQMRYNLAQIYVLLERPADAIREFDTWFATAPNPSGTAYYMHAMAHAQQGNKDRALQLARRAVEKGGADPKESWLQLVASLLVEEKQYAAAVPVLQQLIERFPKKAYWLQLSAVYSGLEQPDNALAVLELADAQGMLTQRTELMTLAQLYLFNQIPARAATVVERGIASGAIEPDARTYLLLADSLLHSRQRERAMAPLQRAAELSDNGNASMRLAQVHLERENWAAARTALASAIDKGGLNSPGHAYLLLGIASANEKRWGDAERAFAEAVAYEPVRGSAEYWLKHLASQRELHQGGATVASGSARPAS
jgi:tetratricopeptide (TPR) repeat protein